MRQISKFLRRVKGAPVEVVRLADNVDQLQGNLNHAKLLIDQQSAASGVPASLEALMSALEHCKARVRWLDELVDRIKEYVAGQNRTLRSWGSLKTIRKTDVIQEAQSQVRDAAMVLQSAIMLNSAISIIEYSIDDSVNFIPTDEDAPEFVITCKAQRPLSMDVRQSR